MAAIDAEFFMIAEPGALERHAVMFLDCGVVGRVGIEPTTTRLKVGCSTAELPAHGGRA